MKEGEVIEHESFGKIEISRFNSNGTQFFDSDLFHQGGISITISNADKKRNFGRDYVHSKDELIRVRLTHNQFVDAITSGMNTSGVPCTIERFDGKGMEQINHIEDKKKNFSNNMAETHAEYHKRIDDILEMLEGSVGKRKAADIKFELGVLKSHIASNTNFVMTTFNEAMDKTVTEAKHSVANYIDTKVHSMGIEGLRDELQVELGE